MSGILNSGACNNLSGYWKRRADEGLMNNVRY